MRLVVIAMTVGLVGTPTWARPEFRTSLLTYGELSQLSVKRRTAYLDDLRHMMIELEKADNQLVASGEGAAFRERLERALRLMKVIPDADAQEDAERPQKNDRRSHRKRPGGAPAEGRAQGSAGRRGLAAPASATAPSPPAGAPSPGSPAPAAGASPAAPSPLSAPAAPAPAVVNHCPEPGFNCATLSADEKAKLEREYRDDPDPATSVCISGGFFSTYPYAKKNGGKCQVMRTYNSSLPDSPSCSDPGRALCNPVVFCAAVEKDVPNSAESRSVQAGICVKYGGKDGYNITESCEKNWLAKIASGVDVPVVVNGQKTGENRHHQVEPCDPQTAKLFEMNNTWKEMRENFSKYYRIRCVDDKRFKSMFCKECQIMAKHVGHMNQQAMGTTCTPTAVPPAVPRASPPSEPGVTPGAVPERMFPSPRDRDSA